MSAKDDQIAALTQAGASLEVAEEFWNLRRLRQAPITLNVVKKITEQAYAADLTLDEALIYAMMRGWQTFMFKWWARDSGATARTGAAASMISSIDRDNLARALLGIE
jgi:hypothetical protein